MLSLELGTFFKQKFGKDPRKLTLEEINEIAVKKGVKGFRSSSLVVVPRGSVFKCHKYDVNELVERRIHEICR